MRSLRFVVQMSSLCAAFLSLSGCSSTVFSTRSPAASNGPAPQVVAVGVQVNGVAPNRWQYVQFNEAMDPASINDRTVVVTDAGGKSVTGNVTYDANFRVAGFDPNPALQKDASYTLTVTTGVASAGEVHLAAPYTYSFVTRDDTDTSPIYVASVSPAPFAFCVSATSSISIAFSEGAEISTVNSNNIVITGPRGEVLPAHVAYDVATATANFSPVSPMPSGTITVTVKNVADAAGVPMRSEYTWIFLTTCSQGGGTAQNFTVLYSFMGVGAHGTGPVAGVVMDPRGNLYGTTLVGGTSDLGTVFKLDKSGKLTILHSFTGGSDGARPIADLLIEQSGTLYGTTQAGGASNMGTVFKIDRSGNEIVLHEFAGPPSDGSFGDSLVMDSTGNLYGITHDGGGSDKGTVYRIDSSGKESVLYMFKGAPNDAAIPAGSIVLDSAGNLYGSSISGGTSDLGTVWKLDAAGHETVLYSFKGGADGDHPSGGLIADSSGNLYGTSRPLGPSSYGTVFKIDPSGHKTLLHTFSGSADGVNPLARLVMDSSGNLYGTTQYGGAYAAIGYPQGLGTVFKVDPSGTETVLHSFSGELDGSFPWSSLVIDPAGNLYGTASSGGASDHGVIFRITP